MRVYLTLAAAVVLAAFFFAFHSEEAPAAPIVGDGSFTLAPQQEQIVFNEAAPMHVGVAIKSNSGDVIVEKFDGANWVSLGTVGDGSACIFEGTYTRVRVRADAAAIDGTFENRGPIYSGDSYVGRAEAVSVSGNVRIYKANSDAFRILSVTSSSGDFELRQTSNGPVLGTIADGDDGFVYGEGTEWWVSGAGTILFDVHVGANPVNMKGTKKAPSDKVIDDWKYDGTVCWAGTITNPGPGSVKVTVKYKNGTVSTSDLAKDEQKEVSCFVTEIKLEFEKEAGKISYDLNSVAVDPPDSGGGG